MKNTKRRQVKLTLQVQTIRPLDLDRLTVVAGGGNLTRELWTKTSERC